MKNFILLLTLTLFLSSCHKDDICGCDGPTIKTVTNLTGVLRKNKRTIFDTEYYIISVSGNFSSYRGICNSNKLNGIVVPENTEVPVIFSGDIKEICNRPISFPEQSYTNIKLTQIQKQ